jgi:hypothetical protein
MHLSLDSSSHFEAAITTRKQRANFRRIGYFIAHCLAFALLPQHLKAPAFAVASLTFCFLWINHRRLFEYWDEEWGFQFLDQVSHVQKALYPENVFAEDILRGYVKEGLEKDKERMRAKRNSSISGYCAAFPSSIPTPLPGAQIDHG